MLHRLLSLLPATTLRGYEHPELVETIFRKTVAYSPSGPWPEMDGVSSVLDFGGACGKHYKEARIASPSIRWAVVETPAMAARARELETHQLKFFSAIEQAAAWLGAIEVVHSSGALQYTPDPIATVRELCSLKAPKMLWSRLLMGEGEKETQLSRLTDNGPGRSREPHKRVSYDRTPISESKFLAEHRNYRIIDRGPDWFKFAR
jgi:putative methyltransferase (TIGR04325 family)